jgi:Na+/proline symporter
VTVTGAGNPMVPDHSMPLPDPEPVVTATATASPAGRNRSSRQLIRGVVAAGLAVLAGVACWWLVGRGVRTDNFPPVLGTQTVTPITRYSGPWLTAAAGAALLAALLLLAAAFDLIRWWRAKAVNSSQ